jgi:hypothetical protein
MNLVLHSGVPGVPGVLPYGEVRNTAVFPVFCGVPEGLDCRSWNTSEHLKNTWCSCVLHRREHPEHREHRKTIAAFTDGQSLPSMALAVKA